MLLPFLVATPLLLGSLLTYGAAMHLIVRVAARLIRTRDRDPGFWKATATMALVTLVMAAAHLIHIALWAVVILLCGPISDPETAFYYSAQNYTALGYGDIQVPAQWRLLAPLEAINGLLFFGLSTAVMFAILSHLIANRIRAGTGVGGEHIGGK
jgi:hypothetical protein